jgi:predicted enzyme related to lactoylglutathione lyase
VNPLVHLELHTGDRNEATAFYARLLQWRSDRVHVRSGSYTALDLGRRGLGGGIVACGLRAARWLPYAEVAEIDAATEQARNLGATVLLAPREGPTGWRSVVATPAGGELALWQPHGRRPVTSGDR